jgi:uncharacterized protein YeaO (DUF488 family)
VTLRVVRLGTRRARGEGTRLGTVRRPPRGVRKADFAELDFFDVWLPELAPSPKLFSSVPSGPWSDAAWKRFARSYRREMEKPASQRLLQTLAALSHQANFSVGCYCADETRCHRSVLKELLREQGAKLVRT